MRRAFSVFAFLLLAVTLQAQQSVTDKVASEDPADEKGKFEKNCLFKHTIGCAEVLFTGQPLHIALGSIAPQNGFAAGLAYVGHKTTDNWRISWNSDAVVSGNTSWRGGLYVKFVDTRMASTRAVMGTESANVSDIPAYVEQPVFTVYAQTLSLNKLGFFGLGPGTSASGRSYYGMTQTLIGGGAVRPMYERLNVGLYGEINGRSVAIRASRNQASPSIEQIYTQASAPGLGAQRFFLQLGVGLRMRPSVANDRLHFNYDIAYRPFLALASADSSFHRISVDLGHEISLYRTHMRLPRETNGPNDCLVDPAADHPRCPETTKMSSMEGTLGVRVFALISMTPAGHTVPFYFQPTLGGADINGNTVVSSYQDYRFRAPNLLFFRENFEHSFGKLPVGFALLADQAKLAMVPSDLNGSHWVHSYTAGFTLRAGGFPLVYLLYAFGGTEGTRALVNMSTSLLGTSGRPSSF